MCWCALRGFQDDGLDTIRRMRCVRCAHACALACPCPTREPRLLLTSTHLLSSSMICVSCLNSSSNAACSLSACSFRAWISDRAFSLAA